MVVRQFDSASSSSSKPHTMTKQKKQEVIENGIVMDSYPCDINPDGELESNGGQEFVCQYMGKIYHIICDWDGNPI